MWYKKMVLPAVLIGATAFSANQAYALNDDEAAVLVGLAVGTVAAVAVKHHREHDRRDWQYREQPRYDDHYRRPPERVEHYVIHNPPQRYAYQGHRHNDRCDHGKHRGHHKEQWKERGYGRGDGRDKGYMRSGYEYEYEYKRRSEF